MSLVLHDVERYAPIILRDPGFSDEEFLAFCQEHDDLRIESTAEGEIVIMPPAGFESGFRESNLLHQLYGCAEIDERGQALGSNTGFRLSNGARRAADAAWISKERLSKLSRADKRVFAPTCPEFVIEVMSPSDRLSTVESKMREWIDNGAMLGWLIDPETQTVRVYRAQGEASLLEKPESVAGEGPVAGFVLDVRPIWRGL